MTVVIINSIFYYIWRFVIWSPLSSTAFSIRSEGSYVDRRYHQLYFLLDLKIYHLIVVIINSIFSFTKRFVSWSLLSSTWFSISSKDLSVDHRYHQLDFLFHLKSCHLIAVIINSIFYYIWRFVIWSSYRYLHFLLHLKICGLIVVIATCIFYYIRWSVSWLSLSSLALSITSENLSINRLIVTCIFCYIWRFVSWPLLSSSSFSNIC